MTAASVSGSTRRVDADPSLETPRSPREASALRKEALREQFDIEILGPGQVRLDLGEFSRFEFLQLVHDVASKLHGRPYITPERLAGWSYDGVFDKRGGVICVNGRLEDLLGESRAVQEAAGLDNVNISDLAVAHAAYFLLTGDDMFNGKTVRAQDGVALGFYNTGLDIVAFDGGMHPSSAAASKLLAA